MSSSIPRVYHDLLNACQLPGCPLCRLIKQGTQQYLDNLLYENVNDGGLRGRLRRSLGFCSRHARQLLEMTDALGICIIYQDILGTVLQELPEEADPNRMKGFLPGLISRITVPLKQKKASVVQVLTPIEDCPACQQEESALEILLTELLRALPDNEMFASLDAADGLCLPHLRKVFDQVENEKEFSLLVGLSRRKIAGLQGELSEFIRKNDYRYREEEIGNERDSGRRVIRLFVGEHPC